MLVSVTLFYLVIGIMETIDDIKITDHPFGNDVVIALTRLP
jgi:hypothetical protein